MAKRHGRKDDNGRILRRANHVGTLYQKSPGGLYYMKFSERDADGNRKRVTFSTGTCDLEEARKALNEKAEALGYGNDEEKHLDAIRKARGDIELQREKIAREQAEAAARAKAEAEAAEALEREKRAITFAEAFAVYLTSKKRPDSGADTLRHYESQYNRLVEWIGRVHPEVTKMRDFTPEMAEQFLTDLEKTQSRNTRNKYLIFLRMFWRVLRWEPDAQLAVDPWEGIKTLTQTPDEVIRRELTVEELAAVAAVINSGEPLPLVREGGEGKSGNIRDVFTYQGQSIRDEVRRLFAVGIFTGQRLGDCASLDWSEVDLVNGIVRITPRKTERKYKREVIIPVHPTFRAILAEIPRAGRRGAVMPIVAEMYAKNPSTLSKTIQTIMRTAGIKTSADAPESGTRSRVAAGFHSLRHTFSSLMLNAGVSPAHVDAMLCHARGSMTMRYFHEHAEALARAVAVIPSLPQYAADQNAVVEAPQDAPRKMLTITQGDAANASHALLDAIREHLGTATSEELTKAVEMLQKEIANRV